MTVSLHRIDLPQKRCPSCGERGGLHFANVLAAKDIGDFSLAGAQLKFSAIEQVICRCSLCGEERAGHLEDVTMTEDGKTFLSGRFVENHHRLHTAERKAR